MGKHNGLSNTRLYKIFQNMKSRCYKEYDRKYKYYGGKGITICDEWLNDFKSFYDWSMANGYTDELTIDRIDSNKGYSPDNCQWIPMDENLARSHSRMLKSDEPLNLNNIKEARINANLTQAEMSEIMAIPKRTIEDWERGTRKPPEYVARLVIAELERIKDNKAVQQ